MAWVATAIVATSVVTSAYGAKQAKKRQKKATEQQNIRDLIEGSAPNISNVQEVIVDELQGSDPGALEDALAAMDYQAQGEVPIPGEAGVPSAAGDMSQMTEEEALQLLQEQGGIMGMSRGGPVGTPNDTYYFGVPQIMRMMKDPNPQIQGVGMQLADQMTSTPGMSMVPATRDQIQGMAYGGQVEPKKLADGDVVEDPMNQVIKDLLVSQIPGVSQARALKDVKEAEGLEKLVEALDLAPINPVKLGRGMKERIAARRAARRAAEEEAESRVFGPR
jgi:hypothetical protein